MPNLVHTSSKLSHLAPAEFGRYMLPVVGPPVKNMSIVYLFTLVLCPISFRLDNCFYSTWHAIYHLQAIFFGNFLITSIGYSFEQLVHTLGENLWTTFSKNTHNGVYIVKGAPPQDVINMFE